MEAILTDILLLHHGDNIKGNVNIQYKIQSFVRFTAGFVWLRGYLVVSDCILACSTGNYVHMASECVPCDCVCIGPLIECDEI